MVWLIDIFRYTWDLWFNWTISLLVQSFEVSVGIVSSCSVMLCHLCYIVIYVWRLSCGCCFSTPRHTLHTWNGGLVAWRCSSPVLLLEQFSCWYRTVRLTHFTSFLLSHVHALHVSYLYMCVHDLCLLLLLLSCFISSNPSCLLEGILVVVWALW